MIDVFLVSARLFACVVFGFLGWVEESARDAALYGFSCGAWFALACASTRDAIDRKRGAR